MSIPALRAFFERSAAHSRKERGFVLPLVLFGLILMSTVAVASLLTSQDEHKSSRAMRESSASFYAAEAGLNEVFATWSTIQTGVDALAPGDSLDLGWRTLDQGASYRAVVHRWHNDDQPMYQLLVEGRNRGAKNGQRMLSFMLTSAPGGGGSGFTLGGCCEATMVVKGQFDISSAAPFVGWDGEVDILGFDEHPAGWEAAGVCADELHDKPAVVMKNIALFNDPLPIINVDWCNTDGNICPVTVDGVPGGIVEDPTITDTAFEQFGGLSWDSLKVLADHEIGVWGTQVKLHGDDIYPRYNGDGTCDTSHPYNWGSDDPDDACFDYFPIIVVRGEIEFNKGYDPNPRAYGQGMLIMDWDDSQTIPGTELELGREGEYNGIVIGKGCLEIQKGFQFRGAMLVNGTYEGYSCDANGQYVECRGHDSESGGRCNNTRVQFSQCAVDRTLSNPKFEDFVEIAYPGQAGANRLVSRSFGESGM